MGGHACLGACAWTGSGGWGVGNSCKEFAEKKKILKGGAGEGEQERVVLLLSWRVSVWDSLVAQQ